jgi:hemerythrin-like domain-containing protein
MQTQTEAEQTELTMISILLVEHRSLRELMAAMSRWMTAGLPPTGLRERAKVLAIALEAHARREENELFDPLRSRSAAAHHLVEMMELVHDEVRMLFDEIETIQDPASRMWTILEMTEAHFVREEREVFPLAVQLLTPAELARPEPSFS